MSPYLKTSSLLPAPEGFVRSRCTAYGKGALILHVIPCRALWPCPGVCHAADEPMLGALHMQCALPGRACPPS